LIPNPWKNGREFHTGHRPQRLHRICARQGAGKGWPRRARVGRQSRGAPRRLKEVEGDIEFIGGDIRRRGGARAIRGVDEVHHLAVVNGIEVFYRAPELVLDVGVEGMINVIDACRSEGVGKLILASNSEVYQTPPHAPTDETAPLLVLDAINPRYSYGGGKIISELMAINYGRKILRLRADLPAAPKLRAKGFKGKLISPLPVPRYL
jgi:nucleoside-diphosphate-sugar epimerase